MKKSKIVLNRGMFAPEAVLNTTYKYSDRCTFSITLDSTNNTIVTFKLKKDANIDANAIIDSFKNELIDQQIRLNIEKEFGYIRDEIVRKAFSPITR